MCGIPWIELLGTVDDWKKIRANAEIMRNFDVEGKMTEWLKDLTPVLDEFVNAAEGRVDRAFRGSVSTLGGGSSGSFPTGTFIMGWVRAFYRPAAKNWQESWKFVQQNGLDGLKALLAQGREVDEEDDGYEDWGHLWPLGTLQTEPWPLPKGVSKVEVKATWTGEGITETLQFCASGMVYQHSDGAVEPRNALAVTSRSCVVI